MILILNFIHLHTLIKNNKEEKHYQTIFYLLFRLMGQNVDVEVNTAIGRADAVVKMQNAILCFRI